MPLRVGCIEPVGNFEGLQKIRSNAYCHDDCDQNHFDVLPPMRFPRHRRELVQLGVERLRFRFDASVIPRLQRGCQRSDP